MSDPAAFQGLRDAERSLNALIAEAEPVVRPVGDMLSDAIGILSGMAEHLYGLGDRLQGDEARQAAAALAQAVAGTGDLAAGARQGGDDMLARLDRDAAEISKHLETLRRIIAEVTALAINGKIQSAMVSTAGVDFTVFTSEIGRLGSLATGQIEQAVAKLASVRQAIGDAVDAEASFARNEAAELAGIRHRLENNLSMLAERSRRAAQAVVAVEAASRNVSSRVAATVGQLQVNDITCQRLDHVRITLHAIAGGGWQEPRVELAGIRLQQRQIDHAAKDYLQEIDAVATNLRGLSQDSEGLLTEAEQAFGDSHGGLFLHEIESDVARAVTLIDAYTEARQRTGSMVAAVSQGFLDMAKDLDAIQSIDADMRIMGLNATLKCGRLGDSGRALGVVAQELRSCSRRTEDTAKLIGGLLQMAVATSRQLGEADSGSSSSQGEAPQRIMERSMAGLSAVSAAMGDSLDALRRDAPALAQSLAGCAGSLTFHHRLRAEADRLIGLIEKDIAGNGAGAPTEADHLELRRHLEPLYTMDSERGVHDAFDGRTSVAAAQAENSDSVDDFFF